MKYLHLIIILFSMHLFAQKNDVYFTKSRIFINSNLDIKALIDNGIAADHGTVKQNTYIESVFSNREIETAKKLGYKVDIIIEDMQKHYLKNVRDKVANNSKNPAPCGATNAYETPSNFNLGSMGGFLTYAQMLDELDEMQSLYPNLITLKSPISTFETIENRPIYWVKISDNPTTDETEPEILYTAIHHAREPASMQQLIFYMWYLLENYDSDTEIQSLVDTTEMYFVPVINVDGYLYNESTNPNGGGYWRKNRRNNGDGSFGVDLNRNYSYEWGGLGTSDSYGETYPGTAGFSEPETQAIKWFCEEHEFVMALNNHTYSQLLLYPFGYDDDQPTPDNATFEAISSLMVSENGYINQISADLYPASGVSDDWMYGDTSTHNKIFAMTPEIGYDFWPSISDIIPICKEMMFHNLTGAHAIHNYASVSDIDPLLMEDLNGDLNYTIQRVGISGTGDFSVSVVPVSSNIISVGSLNTHNNLEIGVEVTAAISYVLDNSIQYGDEIIYKLVVANGLSNTELEVTKVFGTLSQIYYDPCDSATDHWNSSDWELTTNRFVSAPSSITDSESGGYENNSNKSIVLANAIDLTNVPTVATVSFNARWSIENNYDYVQFQVSIDNGITWEAQCGNFTNTGVSNQGAANGQPLYDGEQPNWILEEIDISDYMGEEVLFRFILVSDNGVVHDGFFFDDLTVNIVDATAGISSNNLNHFVLYPNPAKDQLNIKNTNNQNEYSLQIINITGQIVSTHLISNSKSSISLKHINKGIYFVKVFSKGSTKMYKLVKE